MHVIFPTCKYLIHNYNGNENIKLTICIYFGGTAYITRKSNQIGEPNDHSTTSFTTLTKQPHDRRCMRRTRRILRNQLCLVSIGLPNRDDPWRCTRHPCLPDYHDDCAKRIKTEAHILLFRLFQMCYEMQAQLSSTLHKVILSE